MSKAWEPFKLKAQGDFHSKSRMSRLANVMYAHLSDPETQRQMAALAKQEGRSPPVGAVKPKDPFTLRKEYQR